MADMEQENSTYREILVEFQGKIDLSQGNMDVIRRYFQAQKATTSANPTIVVVVTNAIVVVTTAANTVIQFVVSQPIWQPGPSRHDDVYPWGLPPNYTP